MKTATKKYCLFCFLLVLFLSFTASCGGDDDDDDASETADDTAADDTQSDDSAADDAGDDTGDDDIDDTDDDAFSCDSLTDTEKNLFRKVFTAGASYSNPVFGTPPFDMDKMASIYLGMIAQRAMLNLDSCVDYSPEFWVYWDDQSDMITSDTTISMAIDGFFWTLSGTPTEDQIRAAYSEYLDNIYGPTGLEEGETFIAGNIPKTLMTMAGFFGDKERALEIMQEEIDKRPGARLIDFDYYMQALMDGRIQYDGEAVAFFDIIQLDFLHATEFGHQVIADIFIIELNDIYPNLMIEQFGQIEVLEK